MLTRGKIGAVCLSAALTLGAPAHAAVQPMVNQWRFTLRAPAGEWHAVGFDDTGWATGSGGFGREGTPGARVGTAWHTSEIWLRKHYQLQGVPQKPALLLHHDEDITVFINGVQVLARSGYITDYTVIPLSAAQAAPLRTGENLMAVHCRQTTGGQFVDVHLVDVAGLPGDPAFEFAGSQLTVFDRAEAVAPEAAALAELAAGRALSGEERQDADRLWAVVESGDELLADWLWQDFGVIDVSSVLQARDFDALFDRALAKALAETAALAGGEWSAAQPPAGGGAAAKLAFYRRVCAARRQARLAGVRRDLPRLVYARHFVMGGSHYAYTEALSDAQAERQFMAGGRLCLAEWRDGLWAESVLLDAPEGVIRDVDVDYDGGRILFSWKKSDRGDDYSLYEMDVLSRAIRPITGVPGVADYEGCYLPDGTILFNSTRCMQIVDCWWTEVSNLYRCDRDGGNIYRMAFDQVHVNYPTVGDDGTVLYTRWEYNDRSQMYPQPLFQMAPDGTMQSAVYGENSWFPTTIIHARRIPGSHRIFAVATGHHSLQPGALILIDPARGRQEASGVTLIAPVRETKAVRIDRYGQDRDLFAYPYPLDERTMLVTYNPAGWGHDPKGGKRVPRRREDRTTGFGIYWMDIDGSRELLVSRRGLACGRAVPLRPRRRPPVRPSMVDYRRPEGTFYVQDVYTGEPMKGVERGTVKTLRVLGIEYRAAGIGSNSNGGAGGGALVSTPVAVGNGAWDPKILIGDATVHADGSVFFSAECRRPLYFMLLDDKGRMVQSMRSWTMLQPGENASCIGCHEPKNSVPAASAVPTLAMAAGAQRLAPVNGPLRGFSFRDEVQPILDRHCIRCHDGKDEKPDLTAKIVEDIHAKRAWTQSYLTLTHAVPDDKERRSKWRGNADHKRINWISAGSTVELLPPYDRGSNTSSFFAEHLDKGHCKSITAGEIAVLAMWVDLAVPFCKDYEEAALWNDQEREKFARSMEKRRRAEQEDRETLRQLAESAQ